MHSHGGPNASNSPDSGLGRSAAPGLQKKLQGSQAKTSELGQGRALVHTDAVPCKKEGEIG